MFCLVHGSFMNDNYGDFLLYDITADLLEKEIPSEFIWVDNVSKSYSDFRKVNGCNIWRAIWKCNLAIMTGGGYYGEPGNKLYKYYWNLRFILIHALPFTMLALQKKPYIIIGLGVGPLSGKLSRRLARYVFRNAKIITVRDEESQSYIKNNLSVKRDVSVVPDLVMGCNISKYLCEDKWAENEMFSNNAVNLGIHLTTKQNKKRIGLNIVVDEILEFLMTEGNDWNVYFLCDQGGEKQYERQLEIAKRLDRSNVKIIRYESPCKLTTLISKMDIIITDKLHVGIVANKLEKYVIS